jgi:hypothetical protein
MKDEKKERKKRKMDKMENGRCEQSDSVQAPASGTFILRIPPPKGAPGVDGLLLFLMT